VSAQHEPARPGDIPAASEPAGPGPVGGAAPGSTEPGSGAAAPGSPDARKVFRLPGPVVFWWVWVAFAAANLIDLAIQGHDKTSLQIAVGLLAITGLVYACALRPRVIAEARGLTMLNPIRDYRVAWGRVIDIYLGESVQVHCSQPAGAKPKVLHSWALYSPRRSRLRAEVRGRRWDRYPASRPGAYGQLPAEAQEIAKKSPAELMAKEIDGMARRARERGAADGPVVGSWAWPSLAAFLVPALMLVLVIVTG